jgi:hypothetical protein
MGPQWGKPVSHVFGKKSLKIFLSRTSRPISNKLNAIKLFLHEGN